jgi:hypothetical protein
METTMETMKTNYGVIDQLGVLQAQIADLQKTERDLKDQIKTQYGVGGHEGELFRAVVSVSERNTLDIKAAKEKLIEEGFHRFVKTHTKTTQVESVRVMAKNGAILKAVA